MNDIIELLSDIRGNYNCFDENDEPYYRALSEAIRLISACQWIPVSERLPDKEGNYLITAQPTYNHTKDIRIAHWGGRWVGYVKSEILVWMPLPEPYREDNNGTD